MVYNILAVLSTILAFFDVVMLFVIVSIVKGMNDNFVTNLYPLIQAIISDIKTLGTWSENNERKIASLEERIAKLERQLREKSHD